MLSPAKQILYLGTRLEIVNRESKYPHGNKFLVQREWEAVLCHVISPIEDGDGQGGACGALLLIANFITGHQRPQLQFTRRTESQRFNIHFLNMTAMVLNLFQSDQW